MKNTIAEKNSQLNFHLTKKPPKSTCARSSPNQFKKEGLRASSSEINQ